MAAEDTLRPYLERCREQVERALVEHLPTERSAPVRLHAAMRYAVLNGGKRIRPVLVYATATALGVAHERLDAAACAVELIHCYSLVHDDLPAMDDDDLRRGQPTCHKAFDEATALLVGDALQSLAFDVLAGPTNPCTPQARLQMVELLARASGSRGMAGGQAIDLQSVGTKLDATDLENMHLLKTGALIRCSVGLAACGAENLEDSTRLALDQFARCIGLAFQIRDDILDVEGSTAELGKRQGQDHLLDKPTYVTVLGLATARKKAAELHDAAMANLQTLGTDASYLREIADFVVRRNR